MDLKSLVLLKELQAQKEVTLYELSLQTKYTIQEVRESLEHLKSDLAEQGINLLHVRGHYRLEEEDAKHSLTWLMQSEQFLLPSEVRLAMIYLYTFCRMDFVSNLHYQDFLKVSKNTTLSDIRSLRELMAAYQISLVYSRSRGYQLKGEEHDKHRLAFEMISRLLHSPVGTWGLDMILDAWGFPLHADLVKQIVQDQLQHLPLTPLVDRLQEGLYTLVFILCRYQRGVDHVVFTDSALLDPQIVSLVEILLDTIFDLGLIERKASGTDRFYLASILSACFEGSDQSGNDYFDQLTEEIIQEMETISLLDFGQREQLASNLRKHLIPVYYRLRYGVPSRNTYTERIKESYPELFHFVQQSLKGLEAELGLALPDSEIAYFVVHFGGFLEASQPANEKKYKAVLICPNGISSSLMLKETLTPLFPQIEFQRIGRVDQLQELADTEYDLVFTTVPLKTNKPTYFVSVLMTEEQTASLVEMVERDFIGIRQNDLEIDQLLTLIEHYATITRERELRVALQHYIRQLDKRKDVRPLLQELLTEETYQHTTKELGWKEAIRLAAEPLLTAGKITEDYPEAMIRKVEEFGPFINLGKGIAIPHARPDEGVKEVGMSMLVLEHPIYLLDDPKQEIRLLICIAAVDNETHLKALSHLTTILRDNDQVAQLLSSTSYQMIQPLIQQED